MRLSQEHKPDDSGPDRDYDGDGHNAGKECREGASSLEREQQQPQWEQEKPEQEAHDSLVSQTKVFLQRFHGFMAAEDRGELPIEPHSPLGYKASLVKQIEGPA